MRRLLTMMLLPVLATSLAAQGDGKRELDLFQGTWKCVDRKLNTVEGKVLPIPPLGVHRLIVTGSKYKIEVKDLPKDKGDLAGWGSSDGSLSVDASKAPKWFTPISEGGNQPAWLGIYKLEKDRLTLLLRTFDRPRDFEDTKRATLIVFERIDRK